MAFRKKNKEAEDYFRRISENMKKQQVPEPSKELSIDPRIINLIKNEIRNLNPQKESSLNNDTLDSVMNLISVLEDNLNELKKYISNLR